MTTKYASGGACWLQLDLKGAVSGSNIITEVTEVVVVEVEVVEVEVVVVVVVVVTVVFEVGDDLVVGVVDAGDVVVTLTVTVVVMEAISVLLSLGERTVLVYSAWWRVWQSMACRDFTLASLTQCSPSTPMLRYIQAGLSLVELLHYCALIGSRHSKYPHSDPIIKDGFHAWKGSIIGALMP